LELFRLENNLRSRYKETSYRLSLSRSPALAALAGQVE
jgi:hypothetical protein